MGKRRRRNTNTRRKRLYEARMRGKENQLFKEARLSDPQTLTGMTMLSIAEIEEDNKKRKELKIVKEQKLQQEKEEKLLQEQKAKQEEKKKQDEMRKQREKEEEEHKKYLQSRKPNAWKPEESENISWWNYLKSFVV